MDFKEWLLTEMPHGKDEGVPVDFRLEKPNWDKNMRELVMNSKDIDSLLSVFYLLAYNKLLKKRFNELSDIEKSELLEVLPEKFKKDMGLDGTT